MPKKVEVFALGCSKCRLLEVATAMAIDELGMDVQVEKVQDALEMREGGLQSQPALFIDGKLKAAGCVPSVEEIKKMLTDE
jgi:small redox-active disulfide protein 2